MSKNSVRPDQVNLDEEALIRRAQQGSLVAFEALVKRHEKQVLQMALSLVSTPEDAEDVYQEVFVRVFKNLGRFRFESQFSTWLYRVVVNYCINYNKKKSRRKSFSIDDEVGGDSKMWKQTLSGEEISPEESVLNEELSNEIDDALRQLSEQQKTVFVLRHYHGYKLKEIAEIMKCTEGTVKNYLFRATQKMQKLLVAYAQS